MYKRTIIVELEQWRQSPYRKPLLLRGARQVGKTTAVHQFAQQYQQYIYLNLERPEDAALFEHYSHFGRLVEAIFFTKDKDTQQPDTLLFIDEIQAVPAAINLLRYFYEDCPQLHVIAAGSLLETLLNEKITLPVGRIEYRVVRPMSFEEFLEAANETAALGQYRSPVVADYAHAKLLSLFQTYTLIGGMPEIVSHYLQNRNLSALLPLYESLLVAYTNDIEKYARNSNMVQVMRQVVNRMGVEAGNRIKFQGFGQSNYGSREVGEALRTLEKAFLLQLVYPCLHSTLPVYPDGKKSPRLQILDTGMLNHLAGVQKEIIVADGLDAVYRGKIVEHVVGQELLASQHNVRSELHFWTREKKDATAELDFIYPYEGYVFPLKVKAGATGRLKSLQLFMDSAPHHWAVRLYGGDLKIDHLLTPNQKPFYLLNLPYYLAGRIENYLTWLMQQCPMGI